MTDAIRTGVVLLSVVLLSGCGIKKDLPDRLSAEPHPAGMLFQDVRLFDGTDAEAQAHMDVLVQDGRIASVAPTGGAPPTGVTIVPGAGRTLLPGLVDAHVHVMGTDAPPWDLTLLPPEDYLQIWLAAGITTIVDMGSNPKVTADLREGVQQGRILGPRIYRPGSPPVTVSGGHPVPALEDILPALLKRVLISQVLTADSPADAPALIAAMLPHSPDHVKVIYDSIPEGTPHMSRETLGALIEEAHNAELPVSVHVGSPQDMLDAMQLGADILAHGIYKEALTPSQAAEIAASGVPIVYTAWAFEATAQTSEGALSANALDQELVPAWGLEATGTNGARVMEIESMGQMAATCATWRDARRENVRLLYEAGATIVTGSDSPFFGIWAGSGLHHEMEELVASGMSPADVLLGATARAARLFEDNPEYGTIEAGKIADLLLVDGNPLDNIQDTQNIVMVLKDGVELRPIEQPQP